MMIIRVFFFLALMFLKIILFSINITNVSFFTSCLFISTYNLSQFSCKYAIYVHHIYIHIYDRYYQYPYINHFFLVWLNVSDTKLIAAYTERENIVA